MKKKVLSLFLVALLLLVQLTAPAFAADTGKSSPVLKLAAAYNNTAKQVTATVALGPCESIWALSFELQYDKAALSFSSANASGIMQSATVTNMDTNSRVKFMYESEPFAGVNCEAEQLVLSIVFDVIGSGDSTLTLGSIDIVTVTGDTEKEVAAGEGSILTATVKLPGTTTDPTTPDPTTPNPTTPDPTTPDPTTPDPTTPDPTTPDPTTPDPTTPDPTTPDPTTPDIPDPIDPERDIVLVGENNQASHVVTGNTLNVQNDAACVVLYTIDNGETYTKLAATPNEAGGYDFDLTNVPTNAVIKIAIKGDANGDGKLNNLDVTQVKAAVLGKITFDSMTNLIVDVDGTDTVNNLDVTQIKATVLGKISLNW